MFCCIIFELIIWNLTHLVNSPVFFFRCLLCGRWIGNCISALLVCVCECKAAVLYHIKLTTIQLVCTYLPAPVCVYTVGTCIHLKRIVHPKMKIHSIYSPLCRWRCVCEVLRVSGINSVAAQSNTIELNSDHFFKQKKRNASMLLLWCHPSVCKPAFKFDSNNLSSSGGRLG